MKTLGSLKPKESGVIKGFVDESLSIKLMEMGCLPGVKISLQFVAPLGDPIAIEVSGYQLSLRKEEAEKVLLEE